MVIVLNALWHQRFGNFLIAFEPAQTGVRAQRLVASKVWEHYGHFLSVGTNQSAQRLVASKVWELFFGHVSCFPTWCSTPCGIKGLGTPDYPTNQEPDLAVLNALWHQRFGNHLTTKIQASRILCSTPCGIKGLGTLFSRK